MSVETSINNLTAQTASLLDVVVSLKNGVVQQIADAVTISRNAAIIPLITISTNLISTQALLISKL